MKAYRISWLITLILSLTACSGDRFLESRLTPDPSLKNTPSPSPTEIPISPSLQPDSTISPSPLPTVTEEEKLSATFKSYIEDLVSLRIIETGNFFNAPITRREYLRWLFNANNRFYSNLPSLQIRQASTNSTPVFRDLPKNDPDFPLIQGLAEAGIIPSTLTKDNSAVLLRPDTPLTRETILLWKIPLDYRKALPAATKETIKDTWGFQDAQEIDPKIWRGLYVDYQNGEASNLRRSLGYTILLQPKRTVTRAEAAATIWSFGFQDNVLTATDVLKIEASPTPTPTVSSSPNEQPSP